MCFVMKYVPTTQHVFCKRREYFAGKCSVVSIDLRKRELSGMGHLQNLANTSPVTCRDHVH
jgi:hypothetical protein